MAVAPTDLDLLMIGKTGNGKSHTGNSILKRKVFVAKSSSSSVTKEINYDVSEYKGRIIKVVDGPGVGDTRLDNDKAIKLVVKAMEDAIRMNSRGYHAFLLVVRFGGRFTQEDVDTIKFLKKIFGANFVRDFCILVMTCGDSFEYESEETGESFQQWCQNQSGVFKQLLDECSGRIVLFNNVTRAEEEKNKQIDELIALVSGLSARGYRYTDSHFEKASDERLKAIVESKKPIISETSMQECSLILQELERTRNVEDPQQHLSNLNALLDRASTLMKTIQKEDQGTNALRDVEENAKNIHQSITEAINVHVRLEKEKKDLKRQTEEMHARMEEELQEQREAFERQMRDEQRTWEERLEREKELDKERRKLEDERRKQSEKREAELRAELDEARKNMQLQIKALEDERKAVKEKENRGFFAKLFRPILKVFGF